MTGAAGVAATIATIVAAIYAVNAYRANMKTLSETRAQVQAAREANQISSRALAATVGASVHFGPAVFRMFTNTGNASVVSVVMPLGNDGGSTTRGLVYVATCAEFADPPLDPFDSVRLASTRSYRLTLAPKETNQPVVCSYTIPQWGTVMGLKESIYVYGRASYRDTIEPMTSHYLEFCTRLYDIGFTASPFNPGPFSMGEERGKHNCTDDECKTQ